MKSSPVVLISLLLCALSCVLLISISGLLAFLFDEETTLEDSGERLRQDGRVGKGGHQVESIVEIGIA